MGIAFVIAMLMVQAMSSNPGEQWSLEGHRSENPKNELDGCHSLEGPVCEQSVKSDRDPDHGEQIHSNQQAQIDPSESPTPKEYGCSYYPDEWHGHANERAKPRENSPPQAELLLRPVGSVRN